MTERGFWTLWESPCSYLRHVHGRDDRPDDSPPPSFPGTEFDLHLLQYGQSETSATETRSSDGFVTPLPAQRAAYIEHMLGVFKMITGQGFPWMKSGPAGRWPQVMTVAFTPRV